LGGCGVRVELELPDVPGLPHGGDRDLRGIERGLVAEGDLQRVEGHAEVRAAHVVGARGGSPTGWTPSVYHPSVIKKEIAELLGRAGQAAQDAGELPAVALGDVPVERSPNPTRGDYASSIAMRLARAAGLPPLTIAQRLVRHLPPEEAIA